MNRLLSFHVSMFSVDIDLLQCEGFHYLFIYLFSGYLQVNFQSEGFNIQCLS